MEYENFSNILNEHLFEGVKVNLIEKIAKNPERYTGLFRPTTPKSKLIQNITQSNEIRFGDVLEVIFENYFEERNYQLLPKKFDYKNQSYEMDQFMTKDDNYYFIEQKIRDDHDSSKKRGQIDNFGNKIEYLTDEYDENKITAIFYFIDPNLTKNKNYYINELKKITETYDINTKLFYGKELFSYFNMDNDWENFLDNLKSWKISLPEIPELNFDSNAEEMYEDILENITIYYLEKFLSNKKIQEDILPILFPQNLVLEKLKTYYMKEYDKTKKEKFKNISELINTIISDHN